MSRTTLLKLCNYKRWASTEIYGALEILPPEILTADRKIVFGSVLGTLHHLYLMDTVWKSHLEGVPHDVTTRNPNNSPPLSELFTAQTDIDNWYISYVETLNDNLADEIVTFDFIGGGQGSMTRQDIVLHVVNHTTYHRGHIAGMMYESGATPPTTDLPVFLRHCN